MREPQYTWRIRHPDYAGDFFLRSLHDNWARVMEGQGQGDRDRGSLTLFRGVTLQIAECEIELMGELENDRGN